MKQFLLVLDNDQPCFNAIENGVRCAKSAGAFLSAIIISHSPTESARSYPFPNDWELTFGAASDESLEETSADLLAVNKKLLADCCHSENQVFEIIEEQVDLANLVARTKFVDCLLCDGKLNPGRYHITDLLTRAFCPVYLLGDRLVPPRSVVLAYDGSAACMSAARSYTQLFETRVDYVCLHLTTQGLAVPNRDQLDNWLLHHHPDASIVVEEQEVEAGLANWLSTHPADLVIMGSFGRSAVSRFFRHSLASRLLEEGGYGLLLSHSQTD
jgi:hypothetical protein